MSKSNFKQKVLNKIWVHIKDLFYEQRGVDSSVVQNLNHSHLPDQKKALVSYRTDSFFYNWQATSIGRTQPLEILSIVRALADFGYCIDVIDCNDSRAIPALADKRYDLIFGFGENFYQLTQKQPEATTVLYMTEQHPGFSYHEEQKRVSYFNERYKKDLKIARSGLFYKQHHLTPAYTHVIAMGEVEPFLKQYSHVFTIFPTGLQNQSYTFKPKNHQESRTHFLWLGTSGAAIHKGLDLLLDIFAKHNNLVLHIGGLKKSDKKILSFPNRSNIIDHGYIDVKSELFLQLAEQCSYKLLPSCSEACATSVTTGMLHGLVPVVMKDAGFNRLGHHAVFLEDFQLDYLEKKILELAALDPRQLDVMSKRAYNFAHSNFTIHSFELSFRSILEQIETKENKLRTERATPKHAAPEPLLSES